MNWQRSCKNEAWGMLDNSGGLRMFRGRGEKTKRALAHRKGLLQCLMTQLFQTASLKKTKTKQSSDRKFKLRGLSHLPYSWPITAGRGRECHIVDYGKYQCGGRGFPKLSDLIWQTVLMKRTGSLKPGCICCRTAKLDIIQTQAISACYEKM